MSTLQADRQGSQGGSRRLFDAIRNVRDAEADREDVVIDLREAERSRLEMIALEMQPLIEEIDPEDERFSFAVTSGLRPRYWIDSVAHVSIARDRRTYRFLVDTRLGRTVLAESTEIGPIINQIMRYIAERIVERQRLLDGEILFINGHARDGERLVESQPHVDHGHGLTHASHRQKLPHEWSMLISGLAILVAGAACGVALTLALLWASGQYSIF